MRIKTYFESSGIPATGLFPTIRIRNVEDGGNVVASGTMSEVGDGFYRYDFGDYDITKDYCILCDAISLSGVERYKFLATGAYGAPINTLNALNNNIDDKTLLLRRILTNKLILNDGKNANWILSDDDNSELLTWNVSDKLDDGIIQQPNQVSGRTKGE
jgi:hypothetical protein